MRRLAAPIVLVATAWLAGEASADGNVDVRVDRAGNLIVEGDGLDNEISIMPFDVGEGFVVGIGTTLVNGASQAAFSGAHGDFRIRLGGGDDHVAVDDGDGNEVLGDLRIDAGGGDDVVLVRHFIAHGDIRVTTGPGADVVTLEQTAGASPFAEGRTLVRTGTGDDQVLVRGDVPFGAYVRFAQRFEVATGRGRDFVGVTGAIFLDEVDVDLGAGDDLGELGGALGGVCVCASLFLDEDVLDHVRFSGGGGQDGGVLESVCGLAPPGLVDDFLDVEVEPDDCSYLGGEACSDSCEGIDPGR